MSIYIYTYRDSCTSASERASPYSPYGAAVAGSQRQRRGEETGRENGSLEQ